MRNKMVLLSRRSVVLLVILCLLGIHTAAQVMKHSGKTVSEHFNNSGEMDEGSKIRERRQSTPLIKFPSSTPTFIPGKAQTVLITATPPVQTNLLNSYVRLGCFKQDSQPEAQCTITNAALAIGANLVVQRNNKTFGYDFTSLQINWALFDFGKITRSATQLSDPSANTLVFSITVCLADSRDAADGANISLMVEYAFGSYQSSVKTDMKLAVDNSTHIELGYIFFSDILEFFPGDKIKFSFTDSPASFGIVECISTEVLFYIPEWLHGVQFTLPGDGFYGTTFNLITNTNTLVQYSAGAFYFGQTFKIKFSGQVATTVNLPYQSSLLNVQIGLELRCNHYVHGTSVPPGTTEIDRIIKFQTGVIHSKLGQYSVLGLGDPAQIRDCQITASMVAYPQYGPLNIRFQNGTGWLSGFRTSGLQHHNYITIVLGQLTTLYSVRTSSTVTINHRFLDLYASLDGITYKYIKQVIVIAAKRFNGSTAIRNPVEARAFRFVDRTFQYAEASIPFTMELVGKVKANDPYPFDPCSASLTEAPDSYSLPSSFVVEPRVFLYTNQRFFFCDYLLGQHPTNLPKKYCLMTVEGSEMIWYDLGPYISQIVTYLPDEGIIFGISPEQTAVVLTRDYGQHWVSTNADGYDYLVRKARVSVNATAVPWNTIPNQFDAATKGVQCTAYNAGPFNVCFDGIYYNGKQLIDWNSQCPVLR